MPLPITFVIPWFDPGASTGGGAEDLCRAYASRLAGAGHDVEVLTTCSRDHDADWYSDAYAPGRTTTPQGYAVERFPVRAGDRERFLDLNRRILHGSPLSYGEERAFLENSIQSDGLAEAVARRAGRRVVVALPYLFGLTWRVLTENPGRVVLWPCFHEEGYARLKLVADAVSQAAALVFNSRSEADFARRLYAPGQPTAVIGMGVDEAAAEAETPGTQTAPASMRAPYFLCLGRQTPEKGIARLVPVFRAFGAVREERVHLVLAGKGGDDYPAHGTVENLGFVSEERKRILLRGAAAVIAPSERESFSIALLEALASGVPALVNARCAVTTAHVKAGRCGLWYADPDEFAECAAMLLDDPDLRGRLGANARRYVRAGFQWEAKLGELEAFLSGLNGR